MNPQAAHQPVLTAEVVQQLTARGSGVYLDATLGEGGHAAAILDATAPSGRVLGVDLDPRSVSQAARRLQSYGNRFTSWQGNYTDMLDLARNSGFPQVDGVLMDLGFSARQVQEPGYGLSFRRDEPLDMRYDPESPLSAHQIVNSYSEEELAQLIFQYGEEPRARAIVRSIVRQRPITSTLQLADLTARVIGRKRGRGIHPATRTFQALRIAVNGELDNLQNGLTAAMQVLFPGGRLVVISYHSLEDRAVKGFLIRESTKCICPPEAPICVCGHEPALTLVQRRIIRPSAEEVQRNPRSRGAKMRVAQRL